MDWLSTFFWLFVIGPVLPFAAFLSTGLTIALLHMVAALVYEYL